jgi:D-lactate dehydrogenase (cytochrome)
MSTVRPATYTQITTEHIAKLIALLDEARVSSREADLSLHSRDQSFHAAHLPEVVIWPETSQEISQILRYANEMRIPVTPWGAGTSLEGNSIPVHGGILLNLNRMNRIVEVYPDDFQVDVEPGVTRIELNKTLSHHGLFFPPDPGANASIGGMIANNASGIKTIKYGATKDNIMRLEVVLANGEVLHLGTRARKDSSGYDLLHLFIGSEGTLGIITQATLKLAPLPANYSAVLASFKGIEPAMRSVVEIMGAALEPSALEFVDVETVQALKADKGLNIFEAPTLLIEFNGSSDNEGLTEALQICRANGAINVESASGLEERNRLWQARHGTYESLLRKHPGKSQLHLDAAVPPSKYPELVLFADQMLREYNIIGYKFGHAGDGNLHTNMIYDPAISGQFEICLEANERIVARAIELGGTATGEHGVGIGKRKFMAKQHGTAYEAMRQVKQLFDPNGILNPGKIF